MTLNPLWQGHWDLAEGLWAHRNPRDTPPAPQSLPTNPRAPSLSHLTRSLSRSPLSVPSPPASHGRSHQRWSRFLRGSLASFWFPVIVWNTNPDIRRSAGQPLAGSQEGPTGGARTNPPGEHLAFQFICHGERKRLVQHHRHHQSPFSSSPWASDGASALPQKFNFPFSKELFQDLTPHAGKSRCCLGKTPSR